jgi:hypothetical protein
MVERKDAGETHSWRSDRSKAYISFVLAMALLSGACNYEKPPAKRATPGLNAAEPTTSATSTTETKVSGIEVSQHSTGSSEDSTATSKENDVPANVREQLEKARYAADHAATAYERPRAEYEHAIAEDEIARRTAIREYERAREEYSANLELVKSSETGKADSESYRKRLELLRARAEQLRDQAEKIDTLLIYDGSADKLLTTTVLQEFPMPPPEPHGEYDFTHEIRSVFTVRMAGKTPKLRNVNLLLRRVLQDAKYDPNFRYYSPGKQDGFVLVTRIEQIDDTGHPLPTHRWDDQLVPLREGPFTLTAYLSALVERPIGHFRIFAFIVTNQPFTAHGKLTWENAHSWASEGHDALPTQIEQQPFSEDFSVRALSYIFASRGKSGTPQAVKDILPSDKHLETVEFFTRLDAYKK